MKGLPVRGWSERAMHAMRGSCSGARLLQGDKGRLHMTPDTTVPKSGTYKIGVSAAALGLLGLIALFTVGFGQQGDMFIGLATVVLLILGVSTLVWDKKRASFGAFAIAAAVTTILTALLAGFGYASEWWSVGVAFTMLRFAAFAAVGFVLVNIAGAVGAAKAGNKVKSLFSGLSVIACGGLAMMMSAQLGTALSVPPIHDATTDLENILTYATLSPNNPNNDNWRELHASGYPELKPITLTMSVADVIAKAEVAANGFGWDIAVADVATGRFEATETTRFFRFKDDLVLRVVVTGGGKVTVDARSVSRFAGSDIGVNAKRIKRLFAALQAVQIAQKD